MSSDSVAVRHRLEYAIGTGELVGIVYHGGSQPGAFREIAPLQINDDKVRARCYMSNAVKVFSLDKIELRGQVPTEIDQQNAWDANSPRTPPYNDIADIHDYCRKQLLRLGYLVDIETYDDGKRILLRTSFMNGKVRKMPTVSISYEALIWDMSVDEDGQLVRVNERPRQRPWIVRSKRLAAAHTFSDIEAAVRCLLEEASALVSHRE